MNAQEIQKVKAYQKDLRREFKVYVYLEGLRAPDSSPYRQVQKIRVRHGQLEVKLCPTDVESHFWQFAEVADLSQQNEDW